MQASEGMETKQIMFKKTQKIPAPRCVPSPGGSRDAQAKTERGQAGWGSACSRLGTAAPWGERQGRGQEEEAEERIHR